MNDRRLRLWGWAMLALVGILIVWGLARPWGITLDFANFYDAGQKARVGQFADLYNPTAEIAGQPPLGNMSFFSAPATSYLYVPLALLSPHAALFAFKVADTVALIAGLVLLYRLVAPLAGPSGRAQGMFFALFCTAVALFQPFWTIYRTGGQTTPFVFLLLVAGLAAYTRGGLVAAAACYAAAVLIKPVLAPGAILLFFLSPAPFRWTALALGLSAAALSVAGFGLELHQAFVRTVLNESSGLLHPSMNSNPFAFIEPLFVPASDYFTGARLPALPRLIGTVLRLAAIGLLVAEALALRKAGLSAPARRSATYNLSLLLSLVASPVVWAHYLSLVFPLLAAAIALERHLPRAATVVLAATVGLALFQHRIFMLQFERIVGFDSVGANLAVGLIKGVPLLLLLALVLIWRRPLLAALRDPRWAGLGSGG